MVNLSVAIPSYNGREVLGRALANLRRELPDAEVIVIDGHSHDGSARMVEDQYPGVRLFEFKNFGWGHATNRGLSLATGRYLMMLNSDVFVTAAAVNEMRRRLELDPTVGAVGPVLVDEDGRRERVFGKVNLRNYVPATRRERVGLLSGACIMTRRDVLAEVGAIDERFHFYNDDTDWCLRVRRAGYALERVPSRVVHVGGASTPSSPLYTLEAHRGFLFMMSKHFPAPFSEFFRRAMWMRGAVYKRFDNRPEHREMWSRLESLAMHGDYLNSPFPLSGRGETEISGTPPVPPSDLERAASLAAEALDGAE